MTEHIFIRLKWLLDPARTEIWYNHKNKLEIEKLQLEIGQELNIKIGASRYCIGSESSRGKWISCLDRQSGDAKNQAVQALEFIHPDDLTPDTNPSMILLDSRKFVQCYKCSTTDYFSCRMTCQGDYCNASSYVARQMCNPPSTHVYLTFVGNEYKIGVSLNYKRRWLEQGSDLSTLIVQLPGLEARQLEQVGAQEFGLKLQVRGSTKLQNLRVSDLSEAKDKLRQYAKGLRPMIRKILLSTPGNLIEPEIVDLASFYGDYDKSIPINVVVPETDVEFGGKIIGRKGSIIIVKQGIYQYALDFKQLISRSFTLLDRRAKMPTQSFLDQWF